MNDFPETLRSYLEREPSAHPEIVYRRNHEKGRLTASVHGSHIRVTVSLRRSWSALLDYTPTEGEMRRIVARAIRFCDVADLVLKTAVVAGALFVALDIAVAFLPGGPMHHLITHSPIGGAR
jgi:hypothetical protein